MTKFCPVCRRNILPGSSTTQIMSNDYHSTCLYCTQCGRSLWDRPFIRRQDGRLYCEDTNCGKGNNSTEVTSSVGKDYEPYPRNQQNVPNNMQSFNLGKYLNVNEKRDEIKQPPPLQLAEVVKEQKVEPTRVRSGLPRCVKCNLSVNEPDKITWEGRLYHKACFTCKSCKSELFRMKSVLKDQQQTIKNNECPDYYCEPCYADLFGPKCGKCHQAVHSYMLSNSYEGNVYHRECFVCARCKHNLANKQFSTVGKLMICRDCI